MPRFVKIPNLRQGIITPALSAAEKAGNATVRRTAQAVGRRLNREVGLAQRYARARNMTGRGGTTRVRYTRGEDVVWLGLNDVPVDAIKGDVSRGAPPAQVVSQREGPVPRSFFFKGGDTDISRAIPFRRTGPRRWDIERVTTGIQKEGEEIAEDETRNVKDIFDEEFAKRL